MYGHYEDCNLIWNDSTNGLTRTMIGSLDPVDHIKDIRSDSRDDLLSSSCVNCCVLDFCT